jgi:hypothetical protein
VNVTVDGTGTGAEFEAKVGITETMGSGPSICPTPGSGAVYRWSRVQTFDAAQRQWTLYNFKPGTTYYYKVLIGDGTTSPTKVCGELTTTAAPTPTLPANLGYLDLQISGTGASKYVVFDTDDCSASGTSSMGAKQYFVAVDVANQAIVWYLDIAAMSSLGGMQSSGWRYQEGTAPPTSNRILATVSKRYLYEWAMDGTENDSVDIGSTNCGGGSGDQGPCIGHDAFRADSGKTYVIASKESTTGVTSPWTCSAGTPVFVDDGFQRFDGDFSTLSSQKYLMNDYGYSPSTLPGISAPTMCNASYWSPYFDSAYPPIDWTHVNSISVSQPGANEIAYLSLKPWDQIIRVDTVTGAVRELSEHSGYTDTTSFTTASGITGPVGFQDQHDVHTDAAGNLIVFDNNRNSGESRVLRIALSGGPPFTTAQITKSWALVNQAGTVALTCPAQSSGELVPGTSGAGLRVLATCTDEHVIEELSDGTGAVGTAPSIYINLPTDPCTTNGPSDRMYIRGWYRAFPTQQIGEFQ